MNVSRALGISSTKTGLPAPKTASVAPSRWVVRGVLEVELEVYGRDAEEAATEARTALEDVGSRIDAMPSVWSAGGELEAPVER